MINEAVAHQERVSRQAVPKRFKARGVRSVVDALLALAEGLKEDA